MILRRVEPYRLLLFTLAVSMSPVCASGGEPGANDPLKRAGFFGAQVGPLTDKARQEQKLKEGGGTLVMKVIPGSTAEEAGFQAGDVITAVDDSQTPGPAQFVAALSGRKGGDKARLTFVRGGQSNTKAVTIKPRPRETGNADFDVIYDSVPSRGGRLRTIVTRPKASGKKHPVFFLIQGLGGFSVENIPGHPTFYPPIYEDFARRGYVTLRVDKPGQGDSEGGPTRDVDFETELDGYRQALKAVVSYDFVDKDRVFIFGHSMGGVMAPLLAAERPVKGIAAYGTASKTWYEYMLETTRRQMALDGIPASEIDDALRKDAAINHALYAEGRSPEEVVKAHPELGPRIDQLIADGKYFAGRHYKFFHQLAGKNLAAAWEKFDGHALALWGKADFVSTEADHALIAEIVNKAHPGHGTFIAMDGIDHGFGRAASQDESRKSLGRAGRFNTDIVTTLRDWVAKVDGQATRAQ